MVRRIEASLAAGGFTLARDSVAGRQAVIARTSRLGRRTFVLVAVFKDCTPDHLDRFLHEAAQYAATARGGRPGAARVLAAAVTDSAHGAAGWPAAVGPAGGAVTALPVLVDVGRRTVTCPDHAAESAAPLLVLVHAHVAPAVDAAEGW